MSKERDGYREVYSTEAGRLCPQCSKPVAQCRCKADEKNVVTGDGQVRVRRETKGRGGKTVTTVTGLPLTHDQLAALTKELKRVCGAGGAVKDGAVEVQGDHCDSLMRELEKRGFRPKRAGG